MTWIYIIYIDNTVIWEPDESHVSFAVADASSHPSFQTDVLPGLRLANYYC